MGTEEQYHNLYPDRHPAVTMKKRIMQDYEEMEYEWSKTKVICSSCHCSLPFPNVYGISVCPNCGMTNFV